MRISNKDKLKHWLDKITKQNNLTYNWVDYGTSVVVVIKREETSWYEFTLYETSYKRDLEEVKRFIISKLKESEVL